MGSKLKKVAVGGLAFGVFSVVGVALAQWTANGNGTGYARSATAQPVTTSDASAEVVELLWPGSSADVAVKVTNDNPVAMTIGSIVQQSGQPITSSPGGCDAVTFTAPASLDEALAAGETRVITLVDAASMAADAPDACQGQTFAIPVTIGAHLGQTSTAPQPASQMIETTTSGTDWGFDSSQHLGQSFTVPTGTTVTRFDVLVYSATSGVHEYTTTVSIWGGEPGVGTPIHAQEFFRHPFQTGQWASFVLSQPIAVPEGFTVTWTTTDHTTIGFKASTSDVYGGGHGYYNAYSGPWNPATSRDVAVRVFGS